MKKEGIWTIEEIFNYACVIDSLTILVGICSKEINKEKKLNLPQFAKIDILMVIRKSMQSESQKLRLDDFARIKFIQETFSSRKIAYGAFLSQNTLPALTS